MDWRDILITLLLSLAVIYALLLLMMWIYARRNPGVVGLRDALKLVPDLAVLLRRLLADHAVPWWSRLLVGVLVIYLLSPIDLVPDFLPVIGYADDVLVVVWVLRTLVKAAGPEVLQRHWSGSDAGLHAIRRFAGLGEETP